MVQDIAEQIFRRSFWSFSGINSSQMDIFLAEYKKAGIEPIGCKAVVTPDNVFWSADKLFREIFREHLFM